MGYRHFDCIYNDTIFIEPTILENCKNYNINLIPVHSINDLLTIIKSNKYDIFYSALPYHMGSINFPYLKFIMTIHGLRALEIKTPYDNSEKLFLTRITKFKWIIKKIFFPNRDFNINKNMFEKLFSISNKLIITVSKHSKYSISVFFPNIKINEIKVLGAPVDFPNDEEYIKSNDSGNYFLLISANRWEKNAHRAIYALDSLFSSGKIMDKKVIITGAKNMDKIKKHIVNIDNFIFYDYLEKKDLYSLICNAFCFIYPSLNEGFGLPPLLAMYFNVPVIASSTSSIPEVCGDAAIYFNPYSIPEIQNRILQIYNESGIYLKLQEKGQLRIKEIKNTQEVELKNIINIIFAE
jgi:glycosyltransferase involved in cell wall biosynthesis